MDRWQPTRRGHWLRSGCGTSNEYDGLLKHRKNHFDWQTSNIDSRSHPGVQLRFRDSLVADRAAVWDLCNTIGTSRKYKAAALNSLWGGEANIARCVGIRRIKRYGTEQGRGRKHWRMCHGHKLGLPCPTTKQR